MERSRNGSGSIASRSKASSASACWLGPTRLPDWPLLVVGRAWAAGALLVGMDKFGGRLGRVGGLEQLAGRRGPGWRLLVAGARLAVASTAASSALCGSARGGAARVVRGGGRAEDLLAGLGIPALLVGALPLCAGLALLELGVGLPGPLVVAVVVVQAQASDGGGGLWLAGQQGHGGLEGGLHGHGQGGAGVEEQHGVRVGVLSGRHGVSGGARRRRGRVGGGSLRGVPQHALLLCVLGSALLLRQLGFGRRVALVGGVELLLHTVSGMRARSCAARGRTSASDSQSSSQASAMGWWGGGGVCWVVDVWRVLD